MIAQLKVRIRPLLQPGRCCTGDLRVNAIGGSEGGAVKAKKLDYALAPDIESPAFVPFRANPEDANCRLERVDKFLHRQKL